MATPLDDPIILGLPFIEMNNPKVRNLILQALVTFKYKYWQWWPVDYLSKVKYRRVLYTLSLSPVNPKV